MISNIPNNLTLLRIALIPCLILVFYIPDDILPPYDKNLTATLIFLFAAITDWLDGYLARKLDQTSDFGAFIDPVADKLIVIAALILLVDLGRIELTVAFIIIAREFTISSLREWMAKLGKSGGIAVAFIGKFKTTMQMIAILFLLYYENILFFPIALIGKILIYFAALLTIISMIYYLKIAFKNFEKKERLMNKIDTLQKEAKILPSQCGNSSAGRAIPCQGIGREFEPRFPLHYFSLFKERWLPKEAFCTYFRVNCCI